MLHLNFLKGENILVHGLLFSCNPAAIPAYSGNHHLDGQLGSVSHQLEEYSASNLGKKTKKEIFQTQDLKNVRSSSQQVRAHLTTGMMSTIAPIQICSTTIIIGVNELMYDHLIDLILKVHVITTHHYLK